MKVLAHVHMAAPVHGAGAEWALDAILTRLAATPGVEVRLAARDLQTPIQRPGFTAEPLGDLDDHYDWADVVLTHLDVTPAAMAMAVVHRKPLAHLVHNDRQLAFFKVPHHHLAVFNSSWLRQTSRWGGVVCHPPVWVPDYAVDRSDANAVTLLNLSAPKGSAVFYDLADRWPRQRFLGVLGAYNRQDVRSGDNIDVVPNQQDVRTIYAQTKVILMPSSYESFGRVALEAACSGIPTICTPTPGLDECLGDAGTYVPLHDLDAWDMALDCVLDQYDCCAAAAWQRAHAWQDTFNDDLDGLTDALAAYAVAGYVPGPQHRGAQWRPAGAH